METKRDGVITLNGLSADFVFIRELTNAPGWYRVLTAVGETVIAKNQLLWDTKKDLTPPLPEVKS